MKRHILILAAGKGTRMKSALPKVLHPALFQPMLHHVIDLAQSISHDSLTVVVGFGEAEVKEACQQYPKVNFVRQKEQNGTADAVKAAKDLLGKESGSLVVLSGDVILFRRQNLEALLELQKKTKAAACFVTAKLDQPKGYGRVLRDSIGHVVGIREEKDCSTSERLISEVNAGIYSFQLDGLFTRIDGLGNQNEQGEFYLTDIIEQLAKENKGVETLILEDPIEMTGVNDRPTLSFVEDVLRDEINHQWMMEGVTMRNPTSIYIDRRTFMYL